MGTVCSECDPPGCGQECRGGPCGSCNGTGIARPTADLGEDGELVERLRKLETDQQSTLGIPTLINPDGPEAADRLILYKETLAKAQEQVGAYGYSTVHGRRVRQNWATELLAKIDAVLSKN